MIRQQWMEKAETTASLHKEMLRANPKHKLADTARTLNRSIGKVSEDLMLASALKEPEMKRKIERFKYATDAVAFIREKKKEMRML